MAISDKLRDKIRRLANNRCGYCLSQQQYLPYKLEIEHLVPKSRGGSDDESNLWLACRSCNVYKSNKLTMIDPMTGQTVSLFHPVQQVWHDHFEWVRGGTHIQGRTAIGRATVLALQLNNFFATTVRANWIKAGWHPPRS